jgi:hypothetical protein
MGESFMLVLMAVAGAVGADYIEAQENRHYSLSSHGTRILEGVVQRRRLQDEDVDTSLDIGSLVTLVVVGTMTGIALVAFIYARIVGPKPKPEGVEMSVQGGSVDEC